MKFFFAIGLLLCSVILMGFSNQQKSNVLLMINDSYAQYRGSSFNIIDQNNSLIISTDKKSVRLNDTKSLLSYREYIGYATNTNLGSVECVDINPKKTIIATGGNFSSDDENANIRLYDFKSAKLIKTLPQNQIPIKLKFNNEASLLVAASSNTIFIWDIKSYKLIKTLEFKSSLTDFDLYKENSNNIIIVASKNDGIFKYSIEADNYLATVKTHLTKKICLNSNYIVSIGSNDNPEIAIFDHGLNLLKYFIVTPDITQITGFEFKDISSILKLNKNMVTTNLLIRSQHPLMIQDVAITDKQLYVLTNGNLFTIDIMKNWAIADLKNDLRNNIFSIKVGNNQIYLQDNQGFIYKILSTTVNSSDIKGDNIKVISQILEEKLNTLSFTFNEYEISDQIDGGYIFSIKELQSLKNKTMNQVFNGNGNFDVKIKSEGIIFLFKDAMYHSTIQTKNYTTFGFMDNQIALGYKDGSLKIFDFFSNELLDITIHSNQIEAIYYSNNYIVVVDSNKIAKIWDKSKQSLICSIYIDRDNEFVIWTEEGYFTVSSPKALKYITWHMNRGYDKEAYRYDLSKFYDVFFRPDLVKLKLEGKDISPYTGGLTAQEALKNPPPSVNVTAVEDSIIHTIKPNTDDLNITSSQPKVKVRFSVNDEGGGVGTIRIYQEGKLVHTMGSGDIKKVSADADIKSEQNEHETLQKTVLALSKSVNKEDLTFDDRIGKVGRETIKNQSGLYEVEVDLKKGQNIISIEAFNSTNTITSFQSSVQINADIPKQPAKLYAIVVGVNQFDAPFISNLKYAVNDAKAISEEIQKAKKKIYDDVEVVYLIDKEATRKNIEEAFEKIQEKASVNDTIVFYMSSHGISANGTFYLFPSNNINAKEFIDFSKLFKMSSSIKALSQIFLVDACQSGGALDIAASVYDSRASVLARSAGIHLLSASTSGTNAFENQEVQHGAFTYQILSSLTNKKNDINKDGFISIIEVSEELKKQQQDNILKEQFPVIRNVGNDVLIQRY